MTQMNLEPNTAGQSGCTAFAASTTIAQGDTAAVAAQVKTFLENNESTPVLIFDDVTSQVVEIDFRGSLEEVLQRVAANQASPAEQSDNAVRTPGRPKLGVVSREVTLLPRHWEWLNAQPGGASVALRKLVEEAKRANSGQDRIREAREAVYRFMSAMAGNQPDFEEATRALFAGDRVRFLSLMQSWPLDIRRHTEKISGAAFEAGEG